jgi:hypothetical protein
MMYLGPGGSRKTYRSEARAKMYNTGQGNGKQYHPVLLWWPDNGQWPVGGEDDYMETDIGDPSLNVFIHHPNQGSGSAQSSVTKTLDLTQWHNYAIERSAQGIKGWIDGAQWFNFTLAETNGQVPGPMSPTIQLDSTGDPPYKEAKFDVAWLRLYAAP